MRFGWKSVIDKSTKQKVWQLCPENFSLKQWQIMGMKAFLDGKYVFVLLSNGFESGLIYRGSTWRGTLCWSDWLKLALVRRWQTDGLLNQLPRSFLKCLPSSAFPDRSVEQTMWHVRKVEAETSQWVLGWLPWNVVWTFMIPRSNF